MPIPGLKSFADLLQQPDYRLEEAALLVAKIIAHDDLDVGHFLRQFDRASLHLASQISPYSPLEEQLGALGRYLTEDVGLKANQQDYYNPRNSFVNEVWAGWGGIPISLSILYIAVGGGLGLKLYGVGLPGHFVVACRPTQEAGPPLYLDPFHGGELLDEAACQQLARPYLPFGQGFQASYLAPQSTDLILIRLLNNLRQIYLNREDLAALLRVLSLQELLAPRDIDLKRDLGAVCFRLEQWGPAARAFRAFLYARPQDSQAETIRPLYQQALEKLSRLN
jgi:regulator of sirC expression with transglutaminase-like and TPR domain